MMRNHPWFRKITWQEAETLAGRRLDRRFQYYTHTEEGRLVENPYAFNGTEGTPDAKVLTYGEWTMACSGCANDLEYVSDQRGCGCSECGYTGKRRDGMHAPIEG